MTSKVAGRAVAGAATAASASTVISHGTLINLMRFRRLTTLMHFAGAGSAIPENQDPNASILQKNLKGEKQN